MYPNGTVPTESGRYMEDERHSTRRLGKMKSKWFGRHDLGGEEGMIASLFSPEKEEI